MRLTVIDRESFTRVFSDMHEFLQYFEKVCRTIEPKKDAPKHTFKLLSVRKLWWCFCGIRYADYKTESSRHVEMPRDFQWIDMDINYKSWSNEDCLHRQLQHASFVQDTKPAHLRADLHFRLDPGIMILGMVLWPADVMVPCKDKLSSFEYIGWLPHRTLQQTEHQSLVEFAQSLLLSIDLPKIVRVKTSTHIRTQSRHDVPVLA